MRKMVRLSGLPTPLSQSTFVIETDKIEQMKTLTQILTLAACVLLAVAATAQTGIKIVMVHMVHNYNMPSQSTATLTFQFQSGGNDALAFPDQGSVASLTMYGDEVFPFSYTTDQQIITSLDHRSELNSYRTIPMGFVTKSPGDIKVFAEVLSSDPSTPLPDFVWIEQLSTGERFSILDTTKFSITTNTIYNCDFILHTGPAASSTGIDESCYNYGDGMAFVSGPNYPGFTLEFTTTSSPSVPTFTAVVAGTDTIIPNLAAGNYVSVIRINGIPVDSVDVVIAAAAPIIADFITDYNMIIVGTTVNFTDASVGTSLNYIWDFGDGDSSTTAGNESHLYSNTGTFMVNLVVTDVNGCSASVFDFVTVDPSPPAMNNPFTGNHNSSFSFGNGNPGSPVLTSEEDRITYSNERIVIGLSSEVSNISIVAMNGAVIYSGTQNSETAEYAVPSSGAYVITVAHTDGTVQSRTILVQ